MVATKISLAKQLWINAGRTFRLAWQTDRVSFVLFALLSMLTPIIGVAFSYASKLLVDEITLVQSTAGVVTVALLGFFAFRYLLDLVNDLRSVIFRQYLMYLFRFKMENFLTYQMTEKISGLDMAHFEDAKTQDLINKATRSYTWRVPNFTERSFFILEDTLGLVIASVVLLSFGWWIPLVMVGATIPRLWLRTKYSKLQWSVFNLNTPESKELNYLSGILESPASVKEVKIFQATRTLLKRLRKLQETILVNIKKPLKSYIKSHYIPNLIEVAVLALLAYLKLPQTAAGVITLGSFLFYTQMLDRITRSTKEVAFDLGELYEHNLYINHYFEVLDLPELVVEKSPGLDLGEISSPQIEFQNVSFRYPKGPAVLTNISFKLKPGEHLAIVGPNGAGKSTLIKLLLRFYDPAQGQILINDNDLRDLKLDQWYKFIGTLFQDFTNFSFSVKDNILLGNAEVIDEKKMRKAAQQSGAEEFIKEFPRKYNQRLGKQFEDGQELSVGQWQKLALARAFYEEAPVLILDEPTSSIDAEAEARIFDNLYEVYKDKTLILISHRFSTVKNADKIIVLQDGKITEEGNHAVLMEKNGVYARMFRKQAKGYIE